MRGRARPASAIADLLVPLVLIVVLATLLQGATSFALTQLLSKEAQRLIAEMRQRVQAHVSRLPVALLRQQQDRRAGLAHHERRRGRAKPDRHRAGRVRGRPRDRGALALRAAAPQRRHDRCSPAGVLVGFTFVLSRAFTVMRPIFRERGKITADVTGRLTESLGAVRTVKGYHAEAREQGVFARGREAPARQRARHAHRAVGDAAVELAAARARRRRRHVRGRAATCWPAR